MSRAALIDLYISGVTNPAGQLVRGLGGAHELGQWSRDDLISSVLSIEFDTPEVTTS